MKMQLDKSFNVFNPLSGQEFISFWPLTRADAIKAGIAFFYPVGSPCCEVPRHASPFGAGKHYTVSGLAVCCAIEQASAAAAAAAGRGEPMSQAEALAAGLGYYWQESPGKMCGHVGKLTLAGKCWRCRQDRLNSPRQTAIAAGLSEYVPPAGDECPRCGSLAPRSVANGRCSGCAAGAGGSVALMQYIAPELVYSRAEAVAAGLTVYRTGAACRRGHTGYRYVSTGGCLECKAGAAGG